MSEWQWSRDRQNAAQFVAESDGSDKSIRDIAKRIDVTVRTLNQWRKRPEFIEKVSEIRKESAESLKRAGLRVRENRLRGLDEDYERTQKVIDGWAKAYADGPGGDSGLLGRKPNQWGDEYRFISALLRERRELRKHAAIEVGEWIEKQQVDTGDVPLPIDIKLMIDKVYGELEPEKTNGEVGKSD